MKQTWTILALTFSVLSRASAAPAQASFDCRLAKTKIEKQICASDELKSLDSQTAAQYKKLKDYPELQKEKSRITAEAKEWLLKRDQACGSATDSKCLSGLYQERLKSLDQFATPSGKAASAYPADAKTISGSPLPAGQLKALLQEAKPLLLDSETLFCEFPGPAVREFKSEKHFYVLAYFLCEKGEPSGMRADEVHFSVLEGNLGQLKMKAYSSEMIDKVIEQGSMESIELDPAIYVLAPGHPSFLIRVESSYHSTSSRENGTQILLIEILPEELRTVLKLPVETGSKQNLSVDTGHSSGGYDSVIITTGKKTKQYPWKKDQYLVTPPL